MTRNPIHKIAIESESNWPITVWVSGRRNDDEIKSRSVTWRRARANDARNYKVSESDFEVSIVACVKNEASYLLEWIASHRCIGVDHFYIYDNESNDGASRLLSKLSAAGIVSAVFWPSVEGVSKQVSAYNDAVKRFGQKSKWLAFIEADEFVVSVERGKSLKSVLLDFDHAGSVSINRRIFGSSYHKIRTPGLVLERFTLSCETDLRSNRMVKTIAKGRRIRYVNVHVCHLSSGDAVTLDGALVDYEREGGLNASCMARLRFTVILASRERNLIGSKHADEGRRLPIPRTNIAPIRYSIKWIKIM